jgi:tetratricopeptide (TPR) repeat protein
MSSSPRHRQVGRRPRRLTTAQRFYERGLASYQKRQLERAIADLDETIALEPKNAEYYAARGLMLLENGQPGEAEEDFAYALKLDRRQWLAHYGKGMRAFQERRFEDAIDSFSRAQHIAPARPEIYYHRAIAFNLQGNASEAIQDMEYAQSLFDQADPRHQYAKEWITIFSSAISVRPKPKS